MINDLWRASCVDEKDRETIINGIVDLKVDGPNNSKSYEITEGFIRLLLESIETVILETEKPC